MLGYPVATVGDIAADPQLEARDFFQSPAGSRERFCGSFAVIDGARPPLRHAPGEAFAISRFGARHALLLQRGDGTEDDGCPAGRCRPEGS